MTDLVHARPNGEGRAYVPVFQSLHDGDGDGIPELMASADLVQSPSLRAGGTIDLARRPVLRTAGSGAAVNPLAEPGSRVGEGDADLGGL